MKQGDLEKIYDEIQEAKKRVSGTEWTMSEQFKIAVALNGDCTNSQAYSISKKIKTPVDIVFGIIWIGIAVFGGVATAYPLFNEGHALNGFHCFTIAVTIASIFFIWRYSIMPSEIKDRAVERLGGIDHARIIASAIKDRKVLAKLRNYGFNNLTTVLDWCKTISEGNGDVLGRSRSIFKISKAVEEVVEEVKTKRSFQQQVCDIARN